MLCDSGSLFDVVYIDFEKAFDRVSHGILLGKFIKIGVNPYLLALLREFLVERIHFIIIRGATSDIRVAGNGVPQGSSLSPILYMLYVLDIADLNVEGELISYADDVKMGTN